MLLRPDNDYAPFGYFPALRNFDSQKLLTLGGFISVPSMPSPRPQTLYAVDTPGLQTSSQAYADMRIHLEALDIPSQLSMVLSKPVIEKFGNLSRYLDKQYVPYLVNEGDVCDAITYNVLIPLVEPLNDVLSLYNRTVPPHRKWVVELKAQVSLEGARCDHFFVIRPLSRAYDSNYVYEQTTADTEGEPEAGQQYVLLVVEEKRRGYLARFFNSMSEETTVSLRRSLAPFDKATYAQLLKYSDTYQCTRVLLTDYDDAYGLQLEQPVDKDSIFPDRIERKRANLERLQAGQTDQRTAQIWANNTLLEEPDLYAFHWIVPHDGMRQNVFELCLMGLHELGLVKTTSAITWPEDQLAERRGEYRSHFLAKARDEARLAEAAELGKGKNTAEVDAILRQTLPDPDERRRRLDEHKWYEKRIMADLMLRQDYLSEVQQRDPSAFTFWFVGLDRQASERYQREYRIYMRRVQRPWNTPHDLGEPAPPLLDRTRLSHVEISEKGKSWQQNLQLAKYKTILSLG